MPTLWAMPLCLSLRQTQEGLVGSVAGRKEVEGAQPGPLRRSSHCRRGWLGNGFPPDDPMLSL